MNLDRVQDAKNFVFELTGSKKSEARRGKANRRGNKGRSAELLIGGRQKNQSRTVCH